MKAAMSVSEMVVWMVALMGILLVDQWGSWMDYLLVSKLVVS